MSDDMSNVIDIKEHKREGHDRISPSPALYHPANFSSAYDMVLNKTRVERIYEVRRGGRVVTVRRCGYFWVRGWSAKAGWGRNVTRHSKTKWRAILEAERLLNRAERSDERKRLIELMRAGRGK
jgi:hypothetical protein